MRYGKELNILPSLLGGDDETETKLEDVPEERRTELREQICQQIGQSMSFYYTAHQEEWKEFLKVVSQNDG